MGAKELPRDVPDDAVLQLIAAQLHLDPTALATPRLLHLLGDQVLASGAASSCGGAWRGRWQWIDGSGA